jgi:hypothetical protein
MLAPEVTCDVLAFMLEPGDIEQLHRTIERHGRTMRVIQGYAPRKRQQ